MAENSVNNTDPYGQAAVELPPVEGKPKDPNQKAMPIDTAEVRERLHVVRPPDDDPKRPERKEVTIPDLVGQLQQERGRINGLEGKVESLGREADGRAQKFDVSVREVVGPMFKKFESKLSPKRLNWALGLAIFGLVMACLGFVVAWVAFSNASQAASDAQEAKSQIGQKAGRTEVDELKQSLTTNMAQVTERFQKIEDEADHLKADISLVLEGMGKKADKSEVDKVFSDLKKNKAEAGRVEEIARLLRAKASTNNLKKVSDRVDDIEKRLTSPTK